MLNILKKCHRCVKHRGSWSVWKTDDIVRVKNNNSDDHRLSSYDCTGSACINLCVTIIERKENPIQVFPTLGLSHKPREARGKQHLPLPTETAGACTVIEYFTVKHSCLHVRNASQDTGYQNRLADFGIKNPEIKSLGKYLCLIFAKNLAKIAF